jgi:C_GCAxxG_C_C family probable redox protein
VPWPAVGPRLIAKELVEMQPTHIQHDNYSGQEEETPVMKREASQFAGKAAGYFSGDCNCAQSVLLAMQEFYGIRRNRLIPGIATAFGGGIGRRGSLCGALTGAVMAIGLKHGTDRTVLIEKDKAYEMALKFYDRFAKECGSPFCRELIGYDLTDPEELEKMRKSKVRDEKCCGFVKKAVEILIGLET